MPRADGGPASARAGETVAAASAPPTPAPDRPRTGKWDLDGIAERLRRAGINPRLTDTLPPRPDFVGAASLAQFHLGRGAVLAVYLYGDSTARRAVTEGIDPSTAAPPGVPSPWGLDPQPIVSINLYAVLTGASSAMRERVQLALEAGLPPADTISR